MHPNACTSILQISQGSASRKKEAEEGTDLVDLNGTDASHAVELLHVVGECSLVESLRVAERLGLSSCHG